VVVSPCGGRGSRSGKRLGAGTFDLVRGHLYSQIDVMILVTRNG
jgi:hypothetical protein